MGEMKGKKILVNGILKKSQKKEVKKNRIIPSRVVF